MSCRFRPESNFFAERKATLGQLFVSIKETPVKSGSASLISVVLSSIAFGALLSSLLHPGILEILILWAVSMGVIYALRDRGNTKVTSTT